ncbi:MAG: T9SS type A sorting domain-containing protein [Bacteroidales bacterium]
MKKSTLYTIIFLIFATFSIHVSTYATKHVVSVGNFFFSPVNLNVTVGDTIRWVWSAGTHTTTSTPGAIPAGASSWDALITSTITSFEYKVTVAGSYAYVCTPHAPGMAGTFTAAPFIPTLAVSPSNRNVTSAAGSTTFTVVSNSTWSAASNAAWCTVNPTGSGNATVTVNYSANPTNVIRIATITFSTPGIANQTVTVSQAASTVGVSERDLSDLQVYPNPTRGVFKFKAGGVKDQVLDVTLLDLSGKKVLSRICTGSDEYSFDISQEPKGCYFIRISAESTTQVRRIILID